MPGKFVILVGVLLLLFDSYPTSACHGHASSRSNNTSLYSIAQTCIESWFMNYLSWRIIFFGNENKDFQRKFIVYFVLPE